jgi:hypothetical protein
MSQPTTTQDTAQPPRWREAYQNLIAEIRAVREEDLDAITIDIPSAVATVMGLLPEIRALRPRVVKEAPAVDIARFDKMEAYTFALAHAHSLYKAASEPPAPLEQLTDGAAELRETLLADATAFARRGLLDGARLSELKGVRGHKNLAFDLSTLAALIREVWPKIAGKTMLQASELDQAETLADRIVTAVGQREQGPAVVATAAADRQRAFTLFLHTYDQVRRAVHFLRWDQGDADSIVPSLYAVGRSPRRKAEETDMPTQPLEMTKPAVPAAVRKPAAGSGTGARPAVGMPDSDPFMPE